MCILFTSPPSSFSPGKTSPYVVISTIDFPSVTGNDTGVYRCTAQNSNGSSYVNVNLLLYGKKSFCGWALIRMGMVVCT